jgi:ribosome maturation factor RimP
MIEKANIAEFVNGYLQYTNKYLVDIQLKPGNIITLVIDGDTAVAINDCIQLSKFIESKLDRESEDFDLKVSSFGAEKPLKIRRQYYKNIGREVEITMEDDKILIGRLLEVDRDKIKIKPTSKKKKVDTVSDERWINFDVIKQTKVKISFK